MRFLNVGLGLALGVASCGPTDAPTATSASGLARATLPRRERHATVEAPPTAPEAANDEASRAAEACFLSFRNLGPAEERVRSVAELKLRGAEGLRRALAFLNSDKEADLDAALRMLGAMGAAASGAVPRIAAFLHHGNVNVWLRAFRTLSEVGEAAIPTLLDELRGSFDPWKIEAVEALSRISTTRADVVDALLAATKDSDVGVRRAALAAAASLPAFAEKAEPILVQAVKDPSPEIRQAAVETLGELPTHAAAATPALIEALHDADAKIRAAAASALGAFRPASPWSVTALASALGDSDDEVVDRASRALRRLGPSAAAAAPRLVAMVREDPRRMSAVTNVLAEVAPDRLDELSDDDHEETRTALAAVLSGTGPSVRVLRRLLKDASPVVRATAAASAACVPELRDEARSVATSLQSSDDGAVRAAASRALAAPSAK